MKGFILKYCKIPQPKYASIRSYAGEGRFILIITDRMNGWLASFLIQTQFYT